MKPTAAERAKRAEFMAEANPEDEPANHSASAGTCRDEESLRRFHACHRPPGHGEYHECPCGVRWKVEE